eukprot:CAMPEP_0113710338 /NCGR_PEP_ID=MMETSP0038_2-20120614/30096_1 /TAXON_ID=2898 /ORGANISM="Cryptomonas paramecium" /LENGTH=77 /DNA_ID=CAMNT_0000636373 /DNA_START=367 /DNA_END=597 /DNA_ORIENTATION=- /assembly_acc=CAM_ASM_000170
MFYISCAVLGAASAIPLTLLPLLTPLRSNDFAPNSGDIAAILSEAAAQVLFCALALVSAVWLLPSCMPPIHVASAGV